MNLTQTRDKYFPYGVRDGDDGLIDTRAYGEPSAYLKRSGLLSTHDPRATHGVEIDEAHSLLPQPELPLRATYYPLGFPLEVFSNSPAVMAAAEESWKTYQPKFARAPLELRIAVQGDDGTNSTLPPAPVCSLQWDILLCVADARNFVACDLNHGRSFGSITRSTAESPIYLQYHFLEAAALSMVTALHAAPVHAACVCPLGSGMLLCGDSGAGKSSLAYAGARAGWTFVSDDASYLPLNGRDRLVVGNGHKIRFRSSGVELFPELNGRLITPRAAGKPSIEVPTTELSGLTTADSAVVECIVFLNRRTPGIDALVPLSKSSVLPWFMQFITAATQSRAAQEAAIVRLLSVPIFELRYRNLDWAVERLERLAAIGR
jgi:hypothetical protein